MKIKISNLWNIIKSNRKIQIFNYGSSKQLYPLTSTQVSSFVKTLSLEEKSEFALFSEQILNFVFYVIIEDDKLNVRNTDSKLIIISTNRTRQYFPMSNEFAAAIASKVKHRLDYFGYDMYNESFYSTKNRFLTFTVLSRNHTT